MDAKSSRFTGLSATGLPRLSFGDRIQGMYGIPAIDSGACISMRRCTDYTWLYVQDMVQVEDMYSV